MTVEFNALCLLSVLGRVDGPVVTWNPKRRIEETGQPGGHPNFGLIIFLI